MTSQERTLLAVFAHPDDESFGPGGTLAKYAAEGVGVWLVCATDGDAGTVDAEMLANHANMVQLRAAELCCAAQVLCLQGVDWLGYRDSGMAGTPDNDHPDSLFQAPMKQVIEEIVTSIRQHRPQVVICDNEFGGYGHPDHIKLHQATVEAFKVAGDPNQFPGAGPPHQAQRLFFTAFSVGFLKLAVRLMPLFGKNPRKFGRNEDVDLVQIIAWQTSIDARIDIRRHLDTKMKASACHVSQGGGQQFSWMPGFIRRRWLSFETFTQGHPPVTPNSKQVDDLFFGL
ncbi:MAG: PIG-L family deacetylase [Chloroflexota bacterium]|nr:PIG-L family deacetylase [Chloroflexota bacterium]